MNLGGECGRGLAATKEGDGRKLSAKRREKRGAVTQYLGLSAAASWRPTKPASRKDEDGASRRGGREETCRLALSQAALLGAAGSGLH